MLNWWPHDAQLEVIEFVCHQARAGIQICSELAVKELYSFAFYPSLLSLKLSEGNETEVTVLLFLGRLVFDGTPGASFQPITHSPGSYTVTNSDQTKIQQLRAWGVQHKELRPNLHISTMAELSAGNKFLNFTCQITAIAMTTDRNSFVLTVCDGTTPCCPVVLPEKVDVASRVSCDGNTCGRAAGRTVNILLHGSHRRKVAELQPADFVLLNNVHVYLSASATGQNDALEVRHVSSSIFDRDLF